MKSRTFTYIYYNVALLRGTKRSYKKDFKWLREAKAAARELKHRFPNDRIIVAQHTVKVYT